MRTAEQERARQRDYRKSASGRKSIRKYRMRVQYGMTPECFEGLWARQEGRCAGCLAKMHPEGRKGLSVAIDHCHVTGKVRGLLCSNCNRAVGLVKDDPEALRRLAAYLECKP